MRNYVRALVRKYRRDGVKPTVYSVQTVLKRILAGLLFTVIDHVYSAEKTTVCVTIRDDAPESDTFALIDQLEGTDGITHLCIGYPSDFDASHVERLVASTDTLEVVPSKMHTLEFVYHVLGSRLVLLKHDHQLAWYRMMSSGTREFIRLYHGPITKAYGHSRPNSSERGSTLLTFDVDVSNTSLKKSVGSDVELYFRAASEGLSPSTFRTYGYPRFDRLADFTDSVADPILPRETRAILQSTDETTDVLYATTHKDRVYETTFFPFASFDVERLRTHLRAHGIRLFLRPHPIHEGIQEDFVDGDVIFSAGQSFSNSATELMPFFDGLVTDYSSIYIEFLPFDRPILFVKDDHERFREIRGFAFDYDTYFPGPKIDSFDHFLDQLAALSEAESDGYSCRRRFVRNTFVPPRQGTFVERALQGID